MRILAPILSLSTHTRRMMAACLLLSIAIVACTRKEEATPKPQGVGEDSKQAATLCHGSVTNILPRIALAQGFFAAEGLNVTLKDMTDGKLAFEGLLSGECDYAVNGAPPIVLHEPQQAKFTILATVMADDDSAKIIARRDHGITTPQDLKGKRIAIKQGIIGHLFLDLFMMKHGLGPNDVIQVPMEPGEFQAALVSGQIDGFAMTNKLINAAAKTLGEKSVVFAEPGLNTIYGFLTTRTDSPQGQKLTSQLLKALIRAERFAKSDPASAKTVLAEAYKFSAQEVEGIWTRTTIEVALANTIFVNLEDQYKWQVERGFSQGFASPPNFLDVVSPSYLRAIKPEAVSVVKQ